MDQFIIKLTLFCCLLAFISSQELHSAEPLPNADQVANVETNQRPLQASLLGDFLTANPDHPLQHWSQGKVWTGEKWLQHDLVIEQGERWHEVYRYQQERAKRNDSFRENLYLADGCREHGLRAEERAHLTRALLQDYSFHEAHQRLGHVNFNGYWITPRQVQLALLNNVRRRQHFQKWADDVRRIQKKFSKTKPGSVAESKTFTSLKEIRTPDAIPAMERIFASQGARETQAYQDWLETIDSHEAAEALVRQGLFHNSAALRTRANKKLIDRRFDQYVPYALSGLTTIKTRYSLDLVQLPFALPSKPLRVFSKQVTVESADSVLTINGTRTIINNGGFSTRFADQISVSGPSVAKEQAPRLFAQANAGLGDALLADYGQQVFESPQQIRIDRIMRSLATATQTELDEPEDWFAWWRKQNDFVLDGGKLQLNDAYDDEFWYVDNRRVQRVDRLQITQTTPASCFVAKTLIETEHGLRPIEEIRLGDRVLTQDVGTGELTFKPVLQRTERKNASTAVVKTSSGELHCSLGHPFWVTGLGWRMARELEPGMPLYTLTDSSIDVTGITPAKKETVYNLIVADFSTYFVGEQKVFTHDVTPRASTDMVLPGIRKTFE